MRRFILPALLGVLLVFAGCAKEDIQPEPLNASDEATLYSDDDSALKGAKKKFVPLKGTFEVTVTKRYPITKLPPTLGQEVEGSGQMTHLGKTQVFMDQIWYPPTLPPPPPPWTGTGHGNITFPAANGDLLYVTYTAESDHPVGAPVTVIYYCTIMGDLSTGRFEDAQGSFVWNGTFDPLANIGIGTLSDGKIMY